MRIKTISYQRVKNLGNYESERLEMTAEVDEDEVASLAVAQLRDFLEQQLNVRDSFRSLEAKKFGITAQIARLENKYRELSDCWDKVEPLLVANGIELPDIPF